MRGRGLRRIRRAVARVAVGRVRLGQLRGAVLVVEVDQERVHRRRVDGLPRGRFGHGREIRGFDERSAGGVRPAGERVGVLRGRILRRGVRRAVARLAREGVRRPEGGRTVKLVAGPERDLEDLSDRPRGGIGVVLELADREALRDEVRGRTVEPAAGDLDRRSGRVAVGLPVEAEGFVLRRGRRDERAVRDDDPARRVGHAESDVFAGVEAGENREGAGSAGPGIRLGFRNQREAGCDLGIFLRHGRTDAGDRRLGDRSGGVENLDGGLEDSRVSRRFEATRDDAVRDFELAVEETDRRARELVDLHAVER